MKKLTVRLIMLTTIAAFLAVASLGQAKPIAKVGPKSRCAVCGMFVAKYPGWVCQIQFKDGKSNFFDGVKDAMAFYFNPKEFGGSSQQDITELWAQDYYTLQWIDLKKAFFVVGSDVYGPMGHELVPFASNKAATSFMKDHHGKKIMAFGEITPEIVASLRAGQMMK